MFWKVMEIKNAIFQDLESFGKEMIFKIAMEKFWILKISQNGCSLVSYSALYMLCMFILPFINTKHNPPKNSNIAFFYCCGASISK